jgi:hypothetical protein
MDLVKRAQPRTSGLSQNHQFADGGTGHPGQECKDQGDEGDTQAENEPIEGNRTESI